MFYKASPQVHLYFNASEFVLIFQKFMCCFQYLKVLLFLYLKCIILPL